MSIKYLNISLFIVVVLILGIGEQNKQVNRSSYTLVKTSDTYTAGESIALEFDYKGSAQVSLYCSNSYGSVILKPTIDHTLTFHIPEAISNKSGILNWTLHSESVPISGHLRILPKVDVTTIESYLGPPSIEAGGTDYTMLVVIPTDDLDNPLIDSTKVSIKHQFLSNQESTDIFTKHGFGYKTINSYAQSGRMLISSECLALNSKEYDVNVMPAIPTNFDISSERIHNYADGNQMTTFKTSIIRDRFYNIVSDGTFVTFFITNKEGYKAQTSGATINGIAKAKMLHPDHKETWTVKAYIEGMANSESIVLNYEQAVSEFEVSFSEDQRTITVGPLESFMNQRTPDGLAITLKVYKDGTLQDEILERSLNGFAKFSLDKDRFPKGVYSFKIETAGLQKSFANISYE